MKILLAVDGSVYTKRMLSYLAAQELFGDAPEYHAITVVPRVPPRVTRFVDAATIKKYYADEAKRIMKPVHAFAAQHDWTLIASHRVGDAGEMIAAMAKSGKFDLLVMGSHGHSSVGKLLLGSVTERVMARCKKPVMIVR
jgi:nucleotide-binding universal stress UspA family protein